MKIAILSPFNFENLDFKNEEIVGMGGSPTVSLVNSLNDMGINLSIITLSRGISGEKNFESGKNSYFIGKYGSKPARKFFIDEINYIYSALEIIKPDIIHAHWTYEYALAAIKYGGNCIVSAHDSPLKVLRHNFNRFRLIKTFMAVKAIRSARSLTAVSPYVRNNLMALRGDSRIEVIPNGIRFPQNSFQKREEKKVVSILNGDWNGLKNGKRLIVAWSKIIKAHPSAELHVFGDKLAVGGEAYFWAEKNKLNRQIVWHGQRSHAVILSFLSEEAALLIHPSLEEAFGMTILEAMANRVPVIAGARSGAVPWLIGGADNGILVDMQSIDDIASSLNYALDRPEIMHVKAKRAWDDSFLRFNIDYLSKKWLKFYEENYD